MKKIYLAMVLAWIPLTLLAADPVRQVSVQGSGKVSALPDKAIVEVEVNQEGPEAKHLAQAVDDKMKEIFKVIKGLGIEDKDFQTIAFRIDPKIWMDKEGKPQRQGYTASSRVRVTLHDITQVGKLLALAFDAGANDVNGPTFEFENTQGLELQAVEKAVKDAHAKAERMAKAEGIILGKVLHMEKGAVYTRVEPMMAAKVSALSVSADSQAVNIAPGMGTVEASVTVTYLLQ